MASFQSQGILFLDQGLNKVLSAGAYPYFSLKYFVPIYDSSTDLNIHSPPWTDSLSAISNGLSEPSSAAGTYTPADARGEILYKKQTGLEYKLIDSQRILYTASPIVAETAYTNQTSLDPKANVVIEGTTYYSPIRQSGIVISSASSLVTNSGNGVFNATSWVQIAQSPTLLGLAPTTTWDRGLLYDTISYVAQAQAGPDTGVYTVRLGAGIGDFKFNKILLFVQKMNVNNTIDLTQDPVPFGIVTLNKIFEKTKSGNVNSYTHELRMSFARSISAHEITYKSDDNWFAIPMTVGVDGTSAVEYKGSVLIAPALSGVSESEPKAKLDIFDDTDAVPLLRIARAHSSSSSGAFIDINTSTSALKMYHGDNDNVEIGEHAVATGETSVATHSSSATAYMSFAIGYNSKATNAYAVAIGNEANASGLNSFALGQQTLSSNTASLATGYLTSATGSYSFSTGRGTHAIAGYSFAGGYNTIAAGVYSTAIGFETKTNGAVSFSGGDSSRALGNSSISFGYFTSAIAHNSVAFGYKTAAIKQRSMTIGSFTSANGENSFAAGYNTNVYTNDSIVAGKNTVMNIYAGYDRPSIGFGYDYTCASAYSVFGGSKTADISISYSMIITKNVSGVGYTPSVHESFGFISNSSGFNLVSSIVSGGVGNLRSSSSLIIGWVAGLSGENSTGSSDDSILIGGHKFASSSNISSSQLVGNFRLRNNANIQSSTLVGISSNDSLGYGIYTDLNNCIVYSDSVSISGYANSVKGNIINATRFAYGKPIAASSRAYNVCIGSHNKIGIAPYATRYALDRDQSGVYQDRQNFEALSNAFQHGSHNIANHNLAFQHGVAHTDDSVYIGDKFAIPTPTASTGVSAFDGALAYQLGYGSLVNNCFNAYSIGGCNKVICSYNSQIIGGSTPVSSAAFYGATDCDSFWGVTGLLTGVPKAWNHASGSEMFGCFASIILGDQNILYHATNGVIIGYHNRHESSDSITQRQKHGYTFDGGIMIGNYLNNDGIAGVTTSSPYRPSYYTMLGSFNYNSASHHMNQISYGGNLSPGSYGFNLSIGNGMLEGYTADALAIGWRTQNNAVLQCFIFPTSSSYLSNSSVGGTGVRSRLPTDNDRTTLGVTSSALNNGTLYEYQSGGRKYLCIV